MPAADKGKPAKKKVKYTLPKTRVPEAAKPKPKPRKVKPKQVEQARAQERQYASQGESVEAQANKQRLRTRTKAGMDDKSEHDRERGREASERNIREARIRFLRRTRPTGMELVKRELEGKGVLKQIGDKLSEGVENAHIVSTGSGPAVPRIKVSREGKRTKLGGGFATAQPQSVKIPKDSIASNALKDLVNLPAQAIPSLYVPAAALVEASQGDTDRLRQLAKDVDESDPAWNLAVAAVELAGGDTEAAKERLERAKKTAEEHPGFTLAQALGVKGALGRTGGSLARSPVSPRRVRRIASTERENRILPGTDLVEHRSYSPDLITKAGQVAAEKLTGGKSKPISDREIRRRVDENVAVADEVASNRVARDVEDETVGTERLLREFGVDRLEDLPEVALDRLAEHERSRTSGSRVLRLVNRQFRETVLSTSPKWIAGNVIEGLGRAALNRAGPRSYVTGRKVLKRLEQITPDKAEEAMARMVGGGHMASVKRDRVELGPEYWKGTNLAPLADGLNKLWKQPGPKHAAGFWHGWTELVMRQVNGRMETALQTAQLGRELRKSDLMSGEMLKTGGKAIDQAAEGLTKTEQQVRFGRLVDRAYVRYSKLSPGERYWIANFTPFIRWYLNSIDFVTRTLPRDHPVVLAVLASAEIATDEWRQSEDLVKMVDDAMPDWLQGSIPTGGGSHQRASQFGPFGAFSDFTGTGAAQLTPLLTSVASALAGQKWTGDPMRVEGSDGKFRSANEIERAVAAAHEFLKATVPFLSPTERVADKGPRALDPFKDVSPPKAKPKKLKKTRRRKTRFSDENVEWFDEGGSDSSGDGFFESDAPSSSGGSFFP